MRVSALRRIASGVAIVAFAALIVFYGRLIRTVEIAATLAGFVDSDVSGH
jgi:uncharacterized ferredoxin-like protein